jgi:protein-S-isoprenylcysteine O-methyltransferase Ste14
MREAGTNVLPSKPALTLVTSGPFRFTRNPLYVMNALVYLGLTLICNSAWLLGLFVPMLLVIYWGIIRREERYLEAKFGEAYLAYKARVRRWL